MKNKKEKILIVGGGPAGTAAAIALLKQGYDISLFEKEGYEREKVCGDGLLTDAQDALQQIGIWEKVKKEALRLPSATVFGYHNKKFSIPPKFYTLPRKRLDQIIRDEIIKLGGKVFYHTLIKNVAVFVDGVEIEDQDCKKYQGCGLILATGAELDLAHQLGFHPEKKYAISMRAYCENNFNLRSCVFWFNEKIRPGYGWLFPVPGNQINIGIYNGGAQNMNLHEMMNYFIANVEKIYNTTLKFITTPKGWMLRTGLSDGPYTKNRVILTGENISTTYEFIGEGVGNALVSGITAADAIIQAKGDFAFAKLKSYDLKIKRKFKVFHHAYSTAARLAHNKVWHFIFSHVFVYSQKARQKAKAVFENKIKPSEILSVSGMVKALLLISSLFLLIKAL